MKKQAIFTVDVEGHVGSDPVTSLIYGKTKDGRFCGIDMLMDTLDEFGIKGVFFVDIAEAWDYGEEVIANVMRHIRKRGHTVGVHIHPDHMADKTRLFLAEYSYQEQFEIIKKCTDFYTQVMGERPTCFRAGKYGANWDTLNILAELGYSADFSEFYGQKWCKINPPCTCSNAIRLSNGLVEVPVTTYKSFNEKVYSRSDKIDAAMPFSEFKLVVNKLFRCEDYNTIVLFAHSFSFLNWRNKPDKVSFSKRKFRKLYNQLKYVNQELKMNWLTTSEVCKDFGLSDENKGVYLTCKGLRMWLYLAYRVCSVIRARIDIKIRKWVKE